MNSPLRVLHLEDDVRDAELVRATLEGEKIASELTRVETEQDFIAALKDGSFDLILADYTLPSFDGLSALKIALQQLPDVPFIFVSGTLGEDVATEALKTGATDYILKTRLTRLGPAVTRALGEAREKAERKRAEALLAGEKRLLEMVAKGDSLPAVLDALCRLAEEQLPEVLTSVLLLEGNRLRHGAAPSLRQTYIDAVDGLTIGPSEGSCGTAAYRAEPVIVSDIATDPLWDEYRDVALAHSLRACWSTPIFSSDNKVLGTFALYYREPRSPGRREQDIIEPITHIAGVAIQRKSAEEALRRSEEFLADGQRISHTGSWSWNVSTGKVTWSEEHFRIFGYDAKTEPCFQLFLETVHPDDRSFIEQGLDKAIREKSGFDLEFRIALADGSIKHVQGVGRPTLGDSGEVDYYTGTTADITERKRGEALFAGEKRLLEMIATGIALKEILNELCLIIEEYRSGTLASVLLLQPNGLHLDSMAGPTLPRAWTQQMEKVPIGPCAGSCGTAAYRGTPVIVSDIATDPLWELPEHRESALRHGLRASWSNPILSSQGNVLGTFCIYHRETRNPSAHDLGLMEKATDL
ncbi:MAG TPA: GAF domain-containing protein, partial [Chthoniobacterales bacterium]